MRWLLLVLLAACGSNTPPSPEVGGGGAAGGGGSASGGGNAAGGGGQTVDAGPSIGVDHQALSGTRLKQRVITGDDGSQAFAGWFDSMRGENCAYEVAGDGVTRCLPAAQPVNISYTDAACTVPVFLLQASQCAQSYATDISTLTTCPLRWRPHLATAITAPAAVYSNSTGVCTQLPTVAPSGWYSFGAELDAGLFVAGTETVEQ